MCTVIDADTFSYFCNSDSEMYSDFQPVRDWIENSSCKIVYGGTDYKNHLDNHKRFLGHLTEQDRKGKTKHLNDAKVDRARELMKEKFSGTDFNDHHIVALVLMSRSKLVCSRDDGLKKLIDSCYNSGGRAIIKRQLGIKNFRKPNMYSGIGSASTLHSRTSSDNCGPCSHT